VTGGAATQVLPRDSPQLRIDERYQVAQRFFIAVVPGSEQPADVLWTFLSHPVEILLQNSSSLGDPFSGLFPE
jgi:hypothetical protein